MGAIPPLVEQKAAWTRAAPALGRAVDEVEAILAVLGDHVEQTAPSAGDAVLVVRGIDPASLVGALRLEGSDRTGTLDRNHGPEGLAPYVPRPGLGVPDAPAYALVGVERGDAYRGVPPSQALEDVVARGRSPLTIEEGLAAVLVAPALLERGHCFSLAGSTRGDRRVPALWVSADAPKLGWCWTGAPHGWLGLASCASRVA